MASDKDLAGAIEAILKAIEEDHPLTQPEAERYRVEFARILMRLLASTSS
jgi:hypothetical protein